MVQQEMRLATAFVPDRAAELKNAVLKPRWQPHHEARWRSPSTATYRNKHCYERSTKNFGWTKLARTYATKTGKRLETWDMELQVA